MLNKLNIMLHKLILSELAFSIWVSFKEYPNDWTGYEDGYRITHKSGVKIWVANGSWLFNIEHNGSHSRNRLIGIFDRHFVYPAFRAARRKFRMVNKDPYIEAFTNSKNTK